MFSTKIDFGTDRFKKALEKQMFLDRELNVYTEPHVKIIVGMEEFVSLYSLFETLRIIKRIFYAGHRADK